MPVFLQNVRNETLVDGMDVIGWGCEHQMSVDCVLGLLDQGPILLCYQGQVRNDVDCMLVYPLDSHTLFCQQVDNVLLCGICDGGKYSVRVIKK